MKEVLQSQFDVQSEECSTLFSSHDDSLSVNGNMDHWTPFFQFQSHELEFDYLKSVDISETINQIAFCIGNCSSLALLTANGNR